MVTIYDTTLRDGTQGTGISFSTLDKIRVAQRLDDFGVHYIEGGWPGSNPKDAAFFQEAAKCTWKNAKITAFGMTRRGKLKVEDDPQVKMLLDAQRGGKATMGSSDAIANGVQVAKVVEDQTAFPVFYQPGHPDADASGKVLGSNVDLFQELVDMQVIERSFDANLTALRSYRGMLQNTITNMSR